MAFVITGARGYWAEFDISSYGVGFVPETSQEIQEYRPWGLAYVAKEPGLRIDNGTLSMVLHYDDTLGPGEPGLSINNNAGTKVPFSLHLGGTSPTEGEPAYLGNAVSGAPNAPATQGDLAEVDLPLAFDSPMVLGWTMAIGQQTASGNGTGVQYGAVPAKSTLYAVLHVPTATSGTIDVVIESDDNSGFTSATTRLTFTQVGTTDTSEFVSLYTETGITDDYWRARWTSATSPDHTIACAFGWYGGKTS